MAAPNLAFAFGLSPEAAVRYFRSKDIYVPPDWQPISDDVHRRSFTAARISCMDVATALHSEVDRAVNEGITLAEFKRTLTPTLQRLGWWGSGVYFDENDKPSFGMLGSPRRLDIIYGENTRRAYAAGRQQQMLDNKGNRPYWQWIHGASKIPRPSHLALDRRVFRWDDPIWSKIHPCREFGCKCSARALSQADLDAEGLTVESSKNYISEIDDVDAFGNPIKRHSVKMPGMQTAMPLDIVPIEQTAQSELTALALEKAAVAPPVLAAGVVGAILGVTEILDDVEGEFAKWAAVVAASEKTYGKSFIVGVVPEEALRNLAKYLNEEEMPESAVIIITDKTLWHAIRDTAKGRIPLAVERWQQLIAMLKNPEAILLDNDPDRRKMKSLLFMLPSDEGGKDKFVLTLDYWIRERGADGIKRPLKVNIIASGYHVTNDTMGTFYNGERFPVLSGRWEKPQK